MKTFFQLALGACLTSMVGLDLNAQIVWTEPAFPTADDQVTLYYDIAEGNGALLSANPPFPGGPFVYAHTGVITSESTSPADWQHVQNPWPGNGNLSEANNGNVLIPVEGTVHSFDFGGLTLAEYYGVGAGETIEQLAFVFRNANGSIVGKTSDEGDIFYNVSDGSFEVALTSPIGSSVLETLGNTVTLQAQATQPCDLTLHVNGERVAVNAEVDQIAHLLGSTKSLGKRSAVDFDGGRNVDVGQVGGVHRAGVQRANVSVNLAEVEREDTGVLGVRHFDQVVGATEADEFLDLTQFKGEVVFLDLPGVKCSGVDLHVDHRHVRGVHDGRLHFVFFELKACVLDDHAQSFNNFVHQVLSGRDVQHEFIPLCIKSPPRRLMNLAQTQA